MFSFSLRCAALAGGVLLCALALSSRAQTLAPQVVVTGSRTPADAAALAADVVSIDEAQIRASGAATLEDLLRSHAGLQLSRNGGPGQNASVFIRGAGAQATVVLVDGVRVGSATLGQALLESLPLAAIERIEVLRGPGSSLWGADAVGGVVQVFTRRGRGAPYLTLHAAAGELGSAVAEAAAGGHVGAFDFALALGDERSDGVSAVRPGDLFGLHNPDRDGFRRRSAQAAVGFTPAAGHRIGLSLLDTRLNAQYDGAEFLPPTFAPDASADFRNRLATRVAALDYRGRFGAAGTTSVQLARHDDRLESGGASTTRYDNRRDQFTAQHAWAWAAGHQLIAAVEHLDERASAPVFAGDLQRDNTALVLGAQAAFGAHELQADVRHDRSSVWGGVSTWRLGATSTLAPGWRLRALAGTTFRAPSFNELAFPGYGVPTLQPERGRSIELGLRWQGSASDAALTLYRNRVRDLIAYEADRSFCPADPAYDFGCARNLARARLQGATLAAATRQGAWTVRAQLDFVDATDAATGQRLPRRAAHQQTLDAGVNLGAWNLGATLLAVGARPDAGKQLPAYQTLDLRAYWRVAPQWRIEARLLNATDRDIEPARDYAAPGRQAWLGLRYDSRGL
jgi:vitamin B12 transporter